MEREITKQWRSRRRIVLSLALVVVWLVASGGGISSAYAGKGANHCITPTGIDLNARYGVTAQIVAPFCAEVGAGEQWAVSAAWFMSTSFESVPAGFVPVGETPIEDFLAKFVGVTYVVDPGTSQERRYSYANSDQLGRVSDVGVEGVNTVTLGTLHPVAVGTHVVELVMVFSAMHCDGFGDVIDENCLGPGEVVFSRVTFEVTAGH